MVNYDEIKRLCDKDSLTLMAKMLKLAEEVGEASAEALSVGGAPNRSKSAVGTRAALAEELIDVIIVAKSALIDTRLTQDELDVLVAKKLAKWESKIDAP